MRSLLVVVALSAAATGRAEEAAPVVAAKHRISAVTVYSDSALVTREVTVPAGVGPVELVVGPLPAQTVATSLYSEGTDGIRVRNTRFRANAIKEDTREEVRKLDQELRASGQLLQKVQADLKLIDKHEQFLAKLEGFTASSLGNLTDKGMLNSEATIALAKFVMAARAEKSAEAVKSQQEASALAEQIEFLKRQRAEKSAGTSRTEFDAVLVLDKANQPAGAVRLNYYVNSVTWRPHYKFRGGKGNDPVVVDYLASVRQQTGEGWARVNLTLSTAQPMLNAAPPELAMLEVSAVPTALASSGPAQVAGGGMNRYKELQKKAVAGRQAWQVENLRNNPVDAGKALNDAAATEQFGEILASRDEVAQFNRDNADTGVEGPSVTYRMRGAMSLPSRADEQVLEVARLNFVPDYYYNAVPVLTPHVYRQAALTNTSEFVLLPGEATMYQGSDFVGRAMLPLVAIGKQFTVGFGVDPQLQAQRQLVNKLKMMTGGNQVLTFDYRIHINSYKTEPVKLQVWERLPKGEASAVAVNLMNQKPELSGDPMYQREDRPKNLLRWDVVVQPAMHGEKAFAVEYQYRMELDKQMQIGTVAAK